VARELWRTQTARILVTLIAVGGLAFLCARQVGGTKGLWVELGWWAPAASVPLHALVCLSPFPSDVIALANGAVYGPWFGALFGWTGWYTAAWIRFALGRRAGRELPIDRWWRRLPKWLQRIPIRHPVFLILSRYIPYVGGEIATLVPGARGVPAWRFAWCTALAIAPYALLLSFLGQAIAN